MSTPVPQVAPESIGICGVDHDSPRILVIDDTAAIHEDFRKILCRVESPALDQARANLFGGAARASRHLSFVVDSALQGQEGLALVRASLAKGLPYSLAFVDIRMPPGWDGVETVSRLWSADPDLQVVICTAYSDYSSGEMVERFGHTDRLLILKKPFDSVEVLQLAHALTCKWILARQARLRLEDLNKLIEQRTETLRATNERLQAEMAERQQAQIQLRQAQKMEAIGHLAGGVAHDFNNLLAVIRGNADLALMEECETSKTARDCLEQIVGASDRAANLTRQLLAFGRKQIMSCSPLDLAELIGNFTKMLKRIIGEDIDLSCDYGSGLAAIKADAGMLEQVLANLVVNARDAMPKGGRLRISTESVRFDSVAAREHPERSAGDFVCLRVADTGAGIEPEDLPHIFEPFFTTKDVGKGTGLGLATVHGIVHQHGGWIEVASRPGVGSTFSIFLPAVDLALAAPAAVEPHVARPAKGSETILLVEDEESVRSLTARILQSAGYRVHPAASGPAALELWRAHQAEIALVLTDMIMPHDMNGRELMERLRADRPDLTVILMSGYSGGTTGHDTVFWQRTGTPLLQKPCDAHTLLQTVRTCLDSRKPSQQASNPKHVPDHGACRAADACIRQWHEEPMKAPRSLQRHRPGNGT